MARQGKIYSKVRAVDMSSNDGDSGSRLPVFRDCESEQGTLVPKEQGEVDTVKWDSSV